MATDEYTTLTKRAVAATVSADLFGINHENAQLFVKCFKGEGLTLKDLKAAVKDKAADPRMTKCYDKLIGL